MSESHPLIPFLTTPSHPLTPTGGSLIYSGLMAASLAVGAVAWTRRTRGDVRRAPVYLSAVVGALLGAKLGFLLAEGWLYIGDPHRWSLWLTGKTVLGALLGGYAGVEMGKKVAGVRETTGDWFALVVPAGLIAGRVGCLFHGCCQGVVCSAVPSGVWPAAQVELAFNAAVLGVLALLKHRGVQRGQLFHLYLIAYGAFRLLHEPMRATPKLSAAGVGAWLSPYQLLAVGVMALGVWRWKVRAGRQGVA